MKHDEFDELLHNAAQSYNDPPEPPREAMWAAIERSRTAARVVPIDTRRTPRWIATIAGIAAVLMAGIVIGRATRDTIAPSTMVGATADSTPSIVFAAPESATVVATLPSPLEGSVSPLLTEPRAAAAGRAAGGGRPLRNRLAGADASGDQGFRLAILEHLTRTEVLLTTFRADAQKPGAKVDAQFATLSRDLLATTRLLLATRPNEDPIMTRLLEDLELILTQLAQYSRDCRPTDLDAINQTLEKRNVMPKLRSTIPAGVSASAT